MSVLISDFDYILPDERIAKFGPDKRGESRLLVLNRENGQIQDNWYKNLDQYFEAGDLVILNNTKVIPARIVGLKDSDQNSEIEILLTEFHADADEKLENKVWKVIYRGKLKAGDRIKFNVSGSTESIQAEVQEILPGGLANLQFSHDPIWLAEQIGQMPIPPYLKREESDFDRDRYQTEFANVQGSVAAPTASLNFTNELQERLKQKGVIIANVTLHVGLGTFMPVRTDRVDDHQMHSEYFEIPVETVKQICQVKQQGKKVLAVGTTVVRTLEYAADQLRKFSPDSLPAESITGDSDIFIYPGYQFQVVDAMLTNFHAPRSTPLLMVAAFSGQELMQQGYQQALEHEFMFLSYGDSMLIL
ncbi:MAG: tRNA preQ1(34) S-adenosylmethionine ribosyltransferase-isomerase QueA [Patescibacteria group bacterium]